MTKADPREPLILAVAHSVAAVSNITTSMRRHCPRRRVSLSFYLSFDFVIWAVIVFSLKFKQKWTNFSVKFCVN